MESLNATGLTTTTTSTITDLFALARVSSPYSYETYNGGFAGINIDRVDELKSDIQNLIINPVNDAADSFYNTEMLLEDALKGDQAEVALDYIRCAKELIKSYVSQFNSFIPLIDNVVETMIENDRGNSVLIEEAAIDIKAEASKVNVE